MCSFVSFFGKSNTECQNASSLLILGFLFYPFFVLSSFLSLLLMVLAIKHNGRLQCFGRRRHFVDLNLIKQLSLSCKMRNSNHNFRGVFISVKVGPMPAVFGAGAGDGWVRLVKTMPL